MILSGCAGADGPQVADPTAASHQSGSAAEAPPETAGDALRTAAGVAGAIATAILSLFSVVVVVR